MKIGVMSDTHSNYAIMGEAEKWLVEEEKVEKFYHLGDTYQDGRTLLKYPAAVVGVPGNYDPEFFEPVHENIIIDESEGIRFLLVHDRGRIKPGLVKKCDVVLYGHTHHADIYEEDGIIYCNPGHLKAPVDKDREPSFAVLFVRAKTLSISILDLNGKTLQQKTFDIQ